MTTDDVIVWDYRPGRDDPIRHHVGARPARPLAVGDEIVWDDGHTRIVVGTTDRLLLVDGVGRSRLEAMWRLPIEGDYTTVTT